MKTFTHIEAVNPLSLKETSTLIYRFCANRNSRNLILESKYNDLMTPGLYQGICNIQ